MKTTPVTDGELWSTTEEQEPDAIFMPTVWAHFSHDPWIFRRQVRPFVFQFEMEDSS